MYRLYVYMYIPVYIFKKKKKKKKRPCSLSCVYKKMRDHLVLHFPIHFLVDSSADKRKGGGGETVPSQGDEKPFSGYSLWPSNVYLELCLFPPFSLP